MTNSELIKIIKICIIIYIIYPIKINYTWIIIKNKFYHIEQHLLQYQLIFVYLYILSNGVEGYQTKSQVYNIKRYNVIN
jgi:branched-subunit amino acid permease